MLEKVLNERGSLTLGKNFIFNDFKLKFKLKPSFLVLITGQ